MAQTKRAWKLQEFVAHGADVNCVAIGQKTGHVMVTGGEDRKVNLWRVGKPNCVMSLAGHTTPVESVRFGHNEEMVVAGSRSGALKIWDLEEAKIIRTLTGHKSSIRSLDFHPYGDYAASGSLDCNVKLWDIRRKGCIYTYKSHTDAVSSVKFSPDGRWIASAGDDGLVKMWDLTAGKLLTDLRLHMGPVNMVEFHPSELLLASGSSDKTVKFWDLENFQLVDSTEGDASPIRCLLFHPDGSCLYSGSKDILKVLSWEPVKCFDSVPMAWGEVSAVSIAQNQLISASFSKTNVSTFVVDLQRIQPHGGVPYQDGANHLSGGGSRKNFLTERPPTQSTRQASVPKEEVGEPTSSSPDNDQESIADIQDPEDYREIFQPHKRLDRSPSRKLEPFAPPKDEEEPVKLPAPVKKPVQTKPAAAKPPSQPTQRPPATSRQLPQTRVSEPPVREPTQPKAAPVREPAQPKAPTREVPQAKVPPSLKGVTKPRSNTPPQVAPEDFLPTDMGAGEPPVLSEEAIVSDMGRGHKAMMDVLANRSKNLQIVRAMWTSGNTKTAVDSAISMNDQAVMVDVLNVLNKKAGLWNLDISASLLSLLKDLLNHKYETYVMTACDSLRIVLKNFGPVIKANMTAPPSFGVDITREERHRKCNQCYMVLMGIRTVIDKKTTLAGKVGDTFRQLQILIGTLD